MSTTISLSSDNLPTTIPTTVYFYELLLYSPVLLLTLYCISPNQARFFLRGLCLFHYNQIMLSSTALCEMYREGYRIIIKETGKRNTHQGPLPWVVRKGAQCALVVVLAVVFTVLVVLSSLVWMVCSTLAWGVMHWTTCVAPFEMAEWLDQLWGVER